MPSEKRERHRAGRQARMAELRRAQQRRRNLRRGGFAAAIVVIFLAIALLTTQLGGGSSNKKVSVSGGSTTTATAATTTTTASATGGTPLGLSTLESYLAARKPPAISSECNAAPSATTAPTTTVPAKGNAVSIVPAPKTVPFPKLDGSSPRYTHFSGPPPFCIDVTKTYTATMVTDVGTITIHLFPKYAPQTVNNFVFLAGYHYFDGVVFHRVIQGFVDQAGDPTGTGSGGPGYTIPDENPKSAKAYDEGALAMANTGQPNSGGSQFFFTIGNGGSQLSPTYAMFGQVTQGLNVINRINTDGAPASNSAGTPKVVHKILKVTIAES